MTDGCSEGHPTDSGPPLFDPGRSLGRRTRRPGGRETTHSLTSSLDAVTGKVSQLLSIFDSTASDCPRETSGGRDSDSRRTAGQAPGSPPTMTP
ncbi:hypothetical protein GUITHDRAFT_77504 [Guillardia theta CCMP2712]|uniref:Uncharacterized protein n=1 Tax=Guillardia theta (strain CCMP2712) TaxID=905079 RepID=L1INX7_GUITC|nr:hypothetical protein GUITHDRAFT_77504 [Guillardia theta CCMP2712]EKX37991.1 hypothetical protein GUITHDRAFT_77504 [Guillardia theta CCMP2712]|eukprot:XP_005824971.1 hypothetical protein GUITHDRAFT_77504 [Guillardia theta CCMP2712]